MASSISIETSIWTSLFRIKELSRAYERGKRDYKTAEEHYAHASENSNYLYGKKEYHYENMKHIISQNDSLKNTSNETIKVIISHWPKDGLRKEDLDYCSEIISMEELWIQFLNEVPVLKDRTCFVRHILNKFITASDLFVHNEHGHCYATERIFEQADIAARIFLLLDHDNLGKDFGKLFFSDKNESLRFDDQMLSEPYSRRGVAPV